MRRGVLWALCAVLPILVISSCPIPEDLSYELTIVNNSSFAVERVGLRYSGIRSRAPLPPNVVVDASVLAGQTKTIELTLDEATDYYNLFVYNDTDSKSIIWAAGVPDGEHVLLSKGNSSTCTLTDSEATCFAGENSVNPFAFDWEP